MGLAHIKGSATINVVRWLRKHRKERARELLPSRLHRYLQDRLLVSSWFPEQDHLDLLRVLGRLMKEANPKMEADPFALMGSALAKDNFTTVYAQLISPGQPDITLRQAPAMWKAYHDTGRCEVRFVAPRRVELELHDFGCPSPEFCKVRNGFYSEMVRMAGATEVKVVEPSCCNTGAPFCLIQIEWEMAPSAPR